MLQQKGKRKCIVFFICLQLVCSAFIVIISDSVLADQWLMFHHDSSHTGFSPSLIPTQHFLLWNTTVGSLMYSSPAVMDNKLYIGSLNGILYCLNTATGTERWHSSTENSLSSSPAVVNGNVYIGSFDHKLCCFNASDGTPLWNFTTGGLVKSSPTIVDQKIYFGSYDGNLYCINALNGSEIWIQNLGGLIYSSPAVVNGYVIIGSTSNQVFCFNALNGSELWSFRTGGPVFSSPTVTNNKVYVGSDDAKLYCLDVGTGHQLWNYTTGNQVFSSPAVAQNRVYIGSFDFNLYCLDAESGEKIWDAPTGDKIWSSPAVADGKVFIGSSDQRIYCFNATTGVEQWKYLTDNQVTSSPAIVNRTVYVGSNSGKIYCFKGNTQPQSPQIPEGLTDGVINTAVSFSTVAVDSDGDQLQYGWDWDGNGIVDEWTGFYNSGVPIQISYTWASPGIYNVKVKAKDAYQESSWSSPLVVTITATPLPQLMIDVPSLVDEHVVFSLTITANDIAVGNVQVQFANEIGVTDTSGHVLFTAPSVEDHMVFTITASRSGYRSVSKTITVIPLKEQRNDIGWIYGLVTDVQTSLPLTDVQLIVSSGTTRWSTLTDTQGLYVVSVPVGNYAVTANTLGYKTSVISNVLVINKTAKEVNFDLEKEEQTMPPSSQMNYIDYTIQQKGLEGIVGARIDVNTTTEKSIFLFSDEFNIDVNTINNTVMFTVSAENGTNGTILVVRIGEGVLSDLDNVTITYDGNTLQEWTDIVTFFDIASNPDPGWLRTKTVQGLYVFIRVPHFSGHTITITSLVQLFEGPMILLLYTSCAIVALLILFIPRIKNIVRRELYLRKK